MLFDEADSELLKTWVIKRLESVSDADPDVLGDYVLALVSTDDPEPVARKTCNDNLKDFLGDASDTFVSDLFSAIASKSYDPSKPKSLPAGVHQTPRQHNESKKRSHQDLSNDEAQNGQTVPRDVGGRPRKHARRGRGGFDHRGGRQQQQHAGPFTQPPFPQMPTPPPGMPEFDMNNPMASFLAFQQAMGMLPGFSAHDPQAPKPRCRDFDNKGYCTRGAACPYDHGTNALVVPPNDEYDPNQATLLHVQPTRTGVVHTSPSGKNRGRGRGRGRGGNNDNRGGGKRSDFTMLGQNHDRSLTTVVVEQIPEDKYDEQTVRDFFGQFGSIEKLELRTYRRIAVIKFDTYESAKSAYNSPKVIFDNRFVKVYWFRQDEGPEASNGGVHAIDTDMQEQEPEIDPEEVARKQEEAQRKHDEQKRQREEAENKKKEIDAKVKAIEAERKKMADMLAKKSHKLASPPFVTDSVMSDASANPNDTEQTRGLRAQLAKLEAEAKSLGLDPNAAVNSYDYNASSYARGRGGYRGRFRGRGGYAPSYRGGWQGGGAGAVKRLDNRPKTVAVRFTQGSYNDHDEALRQWLLFNGSESATLAKHPSAEDTALVAFGERYLGENFMMAASNLDFPLAGKIELTWYKPETSAVSVAQSSTAIQSAARDAEMQDDLPAGREDQDDRIDDDDRWG